MAKQKIAKMRKINERQFSSRQIFALQGIRAIAFFGIFLSHTGGSIFGGLGPWGVSAFLVMSGFLMTVNHYQDALPLSIRQSIDFTVRRIWKLYPLHIIMLLCAIPLDLGFLGQIGVIKDILLVSVNAALFQAWIPHSKVYFSFNYVSWYLSVCVICYFAFPIIRKIIINRKKARGGGILFAVLLLLQVSLSFVSSLIPNEILGSNGFCKWFVYIFPLMRLIDFILGCEVGRIYYCPKTGNTLSDNQTSIIILIITICIVMSLGCFYLAFPKESELMHTEIWWAYSCLFTSLNCGLVYFVSIDHGYVSRFLSHKVMLWIGELSAYTFLIHQVVLRYGLVLSKWLGFINKEYDILRIILSLILTFFLANVWKKVSEKFVKVNTEK